MFVKYQQRGNKWSGLMINFYNTQDVSLTQAIKEQAQTLGFSLVGVTTPEPLPHTDVFEAWLREGRHGEMTYLASQRSRGCRAHPQRILPGCCSVLALGKRYPAPIAEPEGEQVLRGRVAAYAWGADYHDLLSERLQGLVQFIESQVGRTVPNRWYTDTGPMLEREVAQRAGLGWIGKNTCLINPRHGSYFLLAEVLLGIELEPDQPFTKDRCGTCSRCLDACPTRCILPDRTIDARRCISYLTIELKGSIPLELRPMMDTWVFGCDLCQQACPWNRFAISEIDKAFDHHLAQPAFNLLDEMRLTGDEFRRKYSKSPVMRAKRRGYLRNVAVALGNSHYEEATPALTQVLMDDHEPLVRAHAAWALGQIGNVLARQALERAAGIENDTMVKLEIQTSLDN
jgi:epoxyqueuosine reductase